MGYAVGASCFRDPVEAASAFCASRQGVMSEGVVSCSGAAVEGGFINWTLDLETPGYSTSRMTSTPVVECEPYDFEFFAPVLAAWFVALVAVLCVRLLGRLFNRDTL